MTSVQILKIQGIVWKCWAASAGYRNNKSGMDEVNQSETKLVVILLEMFFTHETNKQQGCYVVCLQLCPKHLPRSSSGRAKSKYCKKQSHLVHDQKVLYCFCIQPQLQSVEESESFCTSFSSQYAQFNILCEDHFTVVACCLLFVWWTVKTSSVTALHYRDKSASMSSWTCPSSDVHKEPSALFIGHSLAGLSGHHRLCFAQCFIAIWRVSPNHT